MRHFITLKDFSAEQIKEISNLAIDIKQKFKQNIHDECMHKKTLGMIFDKSSTRTRVSFETCMNHLGGHSIFLSTNDIQLGRGESIQDTAKVISRMVDFIMLRISSQQDIEEFARHSKVPVINALSDKYHPTQLIADYITMIEYGKENGKIAYIGDGNNMAHSWVILASKLGLDISVASPKEYSVDDDIKEYATQLASKSNSKLLFTQNANEAIKDADIVVTDTYVSMGFESEKKQRDIIFKEYCIDDDMMSLAKKDAIFMHCLPAYRGKEATSSVIDGANSVIYDEAENRLTANKGILKWLDMQKK